MKTIILFILLAIGIQFVHSQECNKPDFVGPNQYDTYFEFEQTPSNWQNFNVHDPTVNKDGIWYYMYNTDVGMGYDPGTGALKRKSKDLINWEFLGQAFNGIPESARQFFLKYNPGYTDNGIWAPFLIKYKNEYRLYYSAPGGLENTVLAFIGYATSNSANGPWTDMGIITSAIPNDTINAIDPTVVIDSITGKHWMAYGSYQTGVCGLPEELVEGMLLSKARKLPGVTVGITYSFLMTGWKIFIMSGLAVLRPLKVLITILRETIWQIIPTTTR